MLQPNCFDNGTRKTLHAYTAPSAICKNTPAIAIVHRLLMRQVISVRVHVVAAPWLTRPAVSPAVVSEKTSQR
jgi:hypothetical protein